MAKQKNDPVWSVNNALLFNPEDPENPTEGNLLFVPAYTARPGQDESSPAGIPVNADMAIHLIQNFLGSNPFLNQKHLKSEKDVSKLRDFIEKAEEFTDKLLQMAYGVTFDKDILLKILSQPGCQGLRLYFCERRTIKPFHTSLVAIGVDKDLYDLNYQGESFTEEMVPTKSLIGEYGYPPDKVETEERLTDSHYYLLKKARGQKKK
jgi:hypothetical protein